MEFSPAKFLNSATCLHDGQRRARADVAESENRGAVADHDDESVGPRVSIGEGFVCSDGAAHLSNTRRVGDREGPLRIERCCGLDRELATDVSGKDFFVGQLDLGYVDGFSHEGHDDTPD